MRRTLVVLATLKTVRITDGGQVLASHERSFDRGRQIEDPEHIAALVANKRKARAHRAQDRLHHAAPGAQDLFRAVAEHGGHLGVLTRGLLKLLDAYGAEALQAAIAEALERDTPSLGAVRQLIEQRRHARGLPPPLPVTLPDDPRIKHLQVRPHSLDHYDRLHDPKEEDPDDA